MENSGKSKQGVLKNNKSGTMQAIQSAFSLHDSLMNVTATTGGKAVVHMIGEVPSDNKMPTQEQQRGH